MTWDEVKSQLKPYDFVEGTVLRHEQYGVFVDIGCSFLGLLSVVDFLDNPDEGGREKVEYPPVGTVVKAVVLHFRDSNQQIFLGVKPRQLSEAELRLRNKKA